MFENLVSLWTNREELRIFVKRHPLLAPFLFIFFQAIQVIVAPIPGEVLGFLAGFFFGAVKGFLISTIGITIGSSVAFFIGKTFQKRFLRKYENSPNYLKIKKNFKKYGIIGAFFLYLFPGFPKDILNYFLGFMPISFKAFIFICTLGRIPGTFILALQGDMVFQGNTYKTLISLGLFGIVFLIFLFFRKKIESWLEISS